ncbi:MAG: adenylate/guanylate cyclase domain-containing protein [Candidatus Eremiobacteraeota bacterium]|nr:adenylate/guanylate cyclase domain-containing protein [Candidatus Eremiobacteraeota bacterium]
MWIERLRESIALQESLRPLLGDRLVDNALEPMRRELRELEKGAMAPPLQKLERRYVTVMFADISGFTALSEREDPERMRAIITFCFTRLSLKIQHYGGTVEKFIGDAIMAIFGAPEAHENDPERACRAALEMMNELSSVNTELGTELGLHVGINSGLVVAGILSINGIEQYVATGDTVNVAARLEDRSERGQIYVGPGTWRHTAHLFEYSALQPLKVKGKSEPLKVYSLLGLKVPGKAPEEPPAGSLSALVSRYEELEYASDIFALLEGGRGAFLVIAGDAGIGKTRLLAAVIEQERRPRFLCLRGRAMSHRQATSFWPVREVLRELFGLQESDDDGKARARASLGIRDVYEENDADPALFLGILLGLGLKEEERKRIEALGPEGTRRQIFSAARRLFRALASLKPVILVMEDMHWADETTLDLVEHLVPLVSHVPLLILCTCRTDPARGISRIRSWRDSLAAQDFHELLLRPLSHPQSLEFIEALSGSGLPREVMEKIWEHTSGNPFFMEEMVRALKGGSAPAKPVKAGEGGGAFPIPETLHAVIMSRVDRLEDSLKGVLKGAAVLGAIFPPDLLDKVLPGAAPCTGALEALGREQFIIIHRLPTGALLCEFIHALARDIIYESIPLDERRRVHGQVAQALESPGAETIREHLGVLAYHWAEAENWEKAQEYLFRIGDAEEMIAADIEALASYRKAFEAHRRVFGDRWEPLRRGAFMERMAETLFRVGAHEEARDQYLQIREILGIRTSSTRNEVYCEFMWQIAALIASYTMPRLPGKAYDPEWLRLYFKVMEGLAWVEFELFPERGSLFSLEHLCMAERARRDDQVSLASSTVGLTLALFLMDGPAEFFLRKALETGERSGFLPAFQMAHFCRGFCHFIKSEAGEAFRHLSIAAESARDEGDVHKWGAAAQDICFLYFLQGRLDESEALGREMVAQGENTADLQVAAAGHLSLALLSLVKGSVETAEKTFRQALALFQRISDNYSVPAVYAFLALTLSCLEKDGEAREAVRSGEEIMKKHTAIGGRNGWLPAVKAALLLRENSWPGEITPKTMKEAHNACRAALSEGKRSLGSMALALCLEGALEWRRGRKKKATGVFEKAMCEAEKGGFLYPLAEVCHHAGSLTGNESWTGKGHEIADRAGIRLMLFSPVKRPPL